MLSFFAICDDYTTHSTTEVISTTGFQLSSYINSRGMTNTWILGSICFLLWIEVSWISGVSGQTNCPERRTGCGTMDLCFLLDASGSICDSDPKFNYSSDQQTCDNWKSIVSFVYNISNQLEIGPNAVRVAVIMFANSARVVWNFSDYTDKTSLLNAISPSLVYVKGGNTDTTGGLNLMNTAIFGAQNTRTDASRTAIIITDGKPTNMSTLPAAIQAVQNNNILTLVVGITNSIDEGILANLSSCPQLSGVTYFITPDYSTINTLMEDLVIQTCATGIPPIATAQPGLAGACSLMDLAFVVDASGSICDSDESFHFAQDFTCQNWNSTVQFIYSIVASLRISPNETRVALIIFATSSSVQWGLDMYSNKDLLLYAIDHLQYNKGGTTDTTGGLKLLVSQVFTSATNRANASKVAIIITDGKPTDPSALPAAIAAVNASNIRTLVVGVTNSVDNNTLQKLSSPPSKLGEDYFMTNSYSTIDTVLSELLNQTCLQVATPTTITTRNIGVGTSTTTSSSSVGATFTATNGNISEITPTTKSSSAGCKEKVLDLCFLIDGSGSICDNTPGYNYSYSTTCDNWESILQFLNNVTTNLAIDANHTRVALVTFASTANLAWNLSTYQDKTSLQQAIRNLKYPGGTTNTTGGLNLMMADVFNAAGSRPYANKTAIIVTDGHPTDSNGNPVDPSKVNETIINVHNAGVVTLVVGVTDKVDEPILELLASPPSESGQNYTFMAPDFNALNNVVNILTSTTCGVGT